MKIKYYITALGLILVFSSYAFAQPNVEKAIKETDRPIREEVEEKLRPPVREKPEIKKEEREEAPAKGPEFFIKKVELTGYESITLEELQALTKRYENKKLTLDKLNILAKEIEREYLSIGIIAACIIPPQEIADQTVTLQIIESRMGLLETADHRFFNKKRIPFYWSVKPGEVLRYDEISRSLQHINKNPDRKAKAALHAGEKPGTTDVLVNVDTRFPVHFIYSFDREGSTYTGIPRTGFGIRHNNLLGLDDTLLVGYTYGADFYGHYIFHTLPITGYGTSVLYGFSHSVARPKKDFDVFEIKSTADSASFFVYQDLYKKDEYAGEVHLGLDAKEKTVRLRNTTSDRDKLRVLRLGGNFIMRGRGNVTYIIPEFSRGLDFLGAKQKNGNPSRGAENSFSKYVLGLRHRRMLPFGLTANLNLKCQLADEKLTPQEELSLGGMNSVRGYPAGNYYADQGIQSNTEILIPAFFIPEALKLPYAANPIKDDITGVVFFDYAYGQRRDISGAEKKQVSMAGFGAGVRINLFNQGTLRLEWGFPVSGYDPTRGSDDVRFHISINIEDKIFDEIERIAKLIKMKRR